MKIIAENFLDLGDAGAHMATAVGFVQSNGGQVHTLIDSVTVEVPGAPPVDIWPLLKTDSGMVREVESWLSDAFDRRCKSVVEAIREQEYRERMEERCEP